MKAAFVPPQIRLFSDLPLLSPGGVIVFVTSHWAHLYGKMQQLPAYEPVAESKYAGEQALRELLPDLDAIGLRLLVVTGNLIVSGAMVVVGASLASMLGL